MDIVFESVVFVFISQPPRFEKSVIGKGDFSKRCCLADREVSMAGRPLEEQLCVQKISARVRVRVRGDPL